MKGLFITLEGCDGLGKSQQAKLLRTALEGLDHNVYATKEPGTSDGVGSPLGDIVRESVFHLAGSGRTLPEGAQQLYLLLDHIDNVSRFEPFLRDGYTVICDRYSDSAFAYASVYNPPTSPMIMSLWEQFRGPEPDFTILLVAVGEKICTGAECYEDISWALSRARSRLGVEAGKQQGKGWNDKRAQRKIQETYLELLAHQPRTITIPVREQDSIEDVHARVMRMLGMHMVSAWLEQHPKLPSQHTLQPVFLG